MRLTPLPESMEAAAINKLKEYAADDSIDAENLAPILNAYESQDAERFKVECKRVLSVAYSSHYAVQELLMWAEDSKLSICHEENEKQNRQ